LFIQTHLDCDEKKALNERFFRLQHLLVDWHVLALSFTSVKLAWTANFLSRLAKHFMPV
jgi:hypothetical protein